MTLSHDAMRDWRLSPAPAPGLREARSAATVHRVTTRQGEVAYLKVTEGAAGPQAQAAARRELAFYEAVAPQLGGAAPRLLEARSSGNGVAVLLEDAGPVVPAVSWDVASWRSLAVTLHRVHDADGLGRAEFRHESALERAMRSPERDQIAQFWDTLSPPLPAVLAMLDELQTVGRVEAFVHGDLHTDNVLQAVSGPTIVDWQECGYASPMADIAFVNVRLAPSGQVAPEAFLEAYVASRGIDADDARLAAVLAELATYLVVWPPFAAYNTPKGVAHVRNRAAELARWAMREVAADGTAGLGGSGR